MIRVSWNQGLHPHAHPSAMRPGAAMPRRPSAPHSPCGSQTCRTRGPASSAPRQSWPCPLLQWPGTPRREPCAQAPCDSQRWTELEENLAKASRDAKAINVQEMRRSEITGLDCGPGQTNYRTGRIEILPDGVLLLINGKMRWRNVDVGRVGSGAYSAPAWPCLCRNDPALPAPERALQGQPD